MAKDSIHYAIIDALLNNGWEITDDPFTIDLEEDNTFFDIDIAAEKTETTLFQKSLIFKIKRLKNG
ncbi:MAG: element excision factor XisH family protein [Bacteroidota bacterium]